MARLLSAIVGTKWFDQRMYERVWKDRVPVLDSLNQHEGVECFREAKEF
jgi:hypothetical protein